MAEWLTAAQLYVYLMGAADTSEPVEAQKSLEKMTLFENRIRLLINPREEDHAELVRLIRRDRDNISQTTEKPSHTATTPTDGCDQIVSIAQSILKREWERVKRGG